jgi:hypothetical protein
LRQGRDASFNMYAFSAFARAFSAFARASRENRTHPSALQEHRRPQSGEANSEAFTVAVWYYTPDGRVVNPNSHLVF